MSLPNTFLQKITKNDSDKEDEGINTFTPNYENFESP